MIKNTSNERFPENYERIEEVMSNYNHEIDRDVEEQLKSGEYCSAYPAWNFHGIVWFDSGLWKCMIEQYRVHIETIVAESLEEIMEEASLKYGDD